MTVTTRSFFGNSAGYRWFQSAQLCLHELLTEIPSLVVGRYITVTSFDSGPLRLSEEEILAGWISKDSIAYSPLVTDPHNMPHDQYDEWYVFQNRITIGSPEVFVNLSAFGLRSPDYLLENIEPTWDRNLANRQSEFIAQYQERFWSQLARIQPESYLAEGDNLICVTRNKTTYDALARFFRANGVGPDT